LLCKTFPLHGHFKPTVLLAHLATPFSKKQFTNPLVLSRGNVRHSLPHADGTGQSFLNSFYDRHYSSRFESACRKILDKRSVSDLPQNGDVLHKHPGIGPMPGKGYM
jgi:hypothetical protein